MVDTALIWTVNGLIGLVALEAVFLLWRRRQTGAPLTRFMPTLLAGLGLLLALRFALEGAPALWVHLCIAASGIAHAIDLIRMWRR